MQKALLFFVLILISSGSYAETTKPAMPDTLPSLGTIKVAPNPNYKTGGLHNFIFGRHWRQVWATPIEVPILDIRTFAGGLTPERVGGGFQTKSLRLKGNNGVVYKFRSVDKDPLKAMPEELRKTIVADILQDQISSYYPLSTQVVKPFTKALGILYSEAQLCVMPRDTVILGELVTQFGGMLGTIEVHPDEHENDKLNFQGADKVVGSHKFYEKLIDDNDELVDSEAYLKARLLDIFLGDWDRHYDQWRWAGYKKGKKRIWKPIPRDRDQAFARLEGPFGWVETQVIPQMNSFTPNYPSIWFLTWSGRRVDRKCLTRLDRKTWEKISKDVQHTLTDSLIEAAISVLPNELQNAQTRWLEDALKSRRDHLMEAAMDMYDIYAAYVDIDGSNDDDYAEIERHRNGSVTVKLYKMDKSEWEKKGKPWYKRQFSPDETSEIRLYLHNDSDKVVVTGSATKSIPVRVIGGSGADQFYDKSSVLASGMFNNNITYFYDSDPDTYFKLGPNTSSNTEKVTIPPDLVEKYERTVRDYGTEWWYSVDNLWGSYSSDFGVLLGHGIRMEHYAFRQSPYDYKMNLQGGYAFGSDKYEFKYHADFRSILPHASLTLDAQTSGLEMLNYYGLGNNTQIDQTRDEDDFYESNVQKTTVSTRLVFPFQSHTLFYAGLDFKHLDIHLHSNLSYNHEEQTYLSLLRPAGIYENQNACFVAGMSIDTRDKTDLSTSEDAHLSFRWQTSKSPSARSSAISGSYLTVEGRYFLNALKNPTDFSKLKLESGTYIPLPFKLSRLALRFGGQKVWGPYPFYEAAFIGGEKTLRGFPIQRYGGDAEMHAGSELRLYLTKFKLLVPIYLGVLGFSETGRVFLEGDEHNDDWHTSVGAGVWFSFVEPVFTFSVSVGRTISEPNDLNKTAVYLTSGFTF